MRQGMSTDSLCPWCGNCPKTIMHVLRDYDGVKEFWEARLRPEVFSRFFSLGTHPWLEWNIKGHQIGLSEENWSTFFCGGSV